MPSVSDLGFGLWPRGGSPGGRGGEGVIESFPLAPSPTFYSVSVGDRA
jgi:hypothetical protein